jgi:uncharacterized protein (TIGR00730 family)
MTAMSNIKTVCVYGGAATGEDPAFVDGAQFLGRQLAARGINMVFGGGTKGLMGHVARAALAGGAHVTGVIPDFLIKLAEASCSELIPVPGMHARKQIMFDMADAFVALPGGIGTVEEVTEQMKWIQLGRHAKPIFIINILDFWSPLISFLESMQQTGFLANDLGSLFEVCNTAEEFGKALDLRMNGGG